MSGYNSPVDPPPGKDGYQGQHPETPVGEVPEWAPGTNPPGTNPPVNPPNDPATNPVPGSVPGYGPPDPDAPDPPTGVTADHWKNRDSRDKPQDKSAVPLAKPVHEDKAKHDKK